tara:strand:+ start:3484 stop:3933 length:450 start_codon:yes stop_codon:yes gene_type:complete
MSESEKIGLKLIGKNLEDLKVISAHLQDSVAIIKDIVFLRKNRTFIMIVNRFMWEDIEKGVFRKNKRIRCAIKFEEVIKVKSHNINQKDKTKFLECLAIKSSLTKDKTYSINIFFSGGGIITLISELIDVVLDDLGEPWYAKHVPLHKI